MHQSVFILALGLLLGIKHAFEPDHLIAISTLVTQIKNPLKASFIGAFWGIGHTLTLLVIGFIVLVFKISLIASISRYFEIGVGIMLVVLGMKVIRNSKLTHIHNHLHDDLKQAHLHPHSHPDQNHKHLHRRSVLIGALHGAAGSGTLMVVVLSTIPSVVWGIYYILLFGLGSVISMTVMSSLMGIPFAYSRGAFIRLTRFMEIGTGVIGIGFGLYMIVTLGLN